MHDVTTSVTPARHAAVLLALAAATLAAWPASGAAPTAPDLVETLGLEEAPQAVRERPGWRRPDRILVRADQARVDWLAEAAPGVELVAVPELAAARTAAPGADAVIGYCDAELLAAGETIRWVQLPYAGVERCVELPVIAERHILLTNAQRVYGPEIAEHVIAMMLSLTRGLNVYWARQQDAEWDRDALPESRLWEVRGKTMLVIGLGGIGTEVARRAHALGMRVLATRGSSRGGPPFVEYVGLADELMELVPRAHVVVNAAPLTPATTGLFDAGFFAAMRPDAWFINVGRGRSVVTEDLLRALEAGAIAGAALDVTDPEPLPPEHPLWRAPNVIITPHVAAGSDLRAERLWEVMRENLRRYVAGEPMLSVVSLEKGY